MNWINSVDMLRDQDGNILLKGFSVKKTRNEVLVERIDSNLDDQEPSKEVVKQICKSMVKKMKATTEMIAEKWSGDEIASQTQQEINDYEKLMNDKGFLIMSIYTKMLQHDEWKALAKDIYKNSNVILSEILPLIKQAKDALKADDVFSKISYFSIRRYLSACACRVLSSITAIKRKLPLDMLLPTLRRLGMMDVLDEKLLEYDDWFGILTDLEKYGDKGDTAIPITVADKVVQERCLIWSKSRANLNYYCKKPPEEPPSGFEYFSKCCNYDCSNYETAENRHTIRCQKCWYFHCCSPGCESYAERTGLHKCDAIPSKKTSAIKKQTQLTLRAFCNFCSALQSDLTAKVVHCDGCSAVQYCCEECKQWDQCDGMHKEHCQKK